MKASEYFFVGGIAGACVGFASSAWMISHYMISQTAVIMLQDKLRRAIGAVRTAMLTLSVEDYGEALASAERHLIEAGEIINTPLEDNGDR